jgi:serine/threonine protein kinase
MGEVHLAHDTILDRPVAVKFISASDPDPEAKRRFMVEARAIARLQHPNVVSIYRVGEVDNHPYLVSEFVQGRGLDTLPLPISCEEVLRMGTEIAYALAAAHQRGVVHRDIKPGNAILAEDGGVKLLDFGIAKLLTASSSAKIFGALPSSTSATKAEEASTARNALALAATPKVHELPRSVAEEQTAPAIPVDNNARGESQESTVLARPNERKVSCEATLPAESIKRASAPTISRPIGFATPPELWSTQPGMICGTPSYMAPEIWRGEPATFRSDIYSFGALLYTLCTGHPPQVRTSITALQEAVQNQDAPPLIEAAPGMNPAFCAIVDRCLARDPQKRFASGNEVRVALA